MDMFDVSFNPLKNTTLNVNNEVYSLTGFVVTMKRSPIPFYGGRAFKSEIVARTA